METKEINEFIGWEIKRLNEFYKDKPEEERKLLTALKLTEEVGELANEILSHKGFQRKKKLKKLDNEDMEKELADVILTTIILARKFDIDIWKAVEKKINKIKNRVYDK